MWVGKCLWVGGWVSVRGGRGGEGRGLSRRHPPSLTPAPPPPHPTPPPPMQRYKYRLVVDESLALGVLGARGRGAAEAAGLQPGDVEIVGASMGERVGG